MPRLPSSLSKFDGAATAPHQISTYWNHRPSMDHVNPPSTVATSQDSMMEAEPGVGLPDVLGSHEHRLCFRTRQSSTATEQWLTTESPIARATSFSSQTLPHASFRLPSLSLQSAIPDSAAQSQTQYVSDMPLAISNMDTNLPEQNAADEFHLSQIMNTQDADFWAMNGTSPVQHQGMHWVLGQEYIHTRYPSPSVSPYSSPTILHGSPTMSEYCSSPEPYPSGLVGRIPRSQPKDYQDFEEGDEMNGGKPYAQLIQECLLQAPGHKMMLRDIYQWFEANTSKPLECSGNGWQNSIRHNLSMNQAFENDKTTVTNSRGEPKKATSIWYLTADALRHGVQSTTRYRKSNAQRRSPYRHERDHKRMCSGSKGGRAARKATHMRRLKAERWTPCMSPESLKPFDVLLRAANAYEDNPESRGSSPSSPADDYPCTPIDTFARGDYHLDTTIGPLCHADELSINDLQLHDALNQAGYGQHHEMLW